MSESIPKPCARSLSIPGFLIYEIKRDAFQLLGTRYVNLKYGKMDIAKAIDLIYDCKYVITRRAGFRAIEQLKKRGSS